MIAVITVISFSSCTVEYRAHHQRHHRYYNYVPSPNDKLQTVSILPVSSPKTPVTR